MLLPLTDLSVRPPKASGPSGSKSRAGFFPRPDPYMKKLLMMLLPLTDISVRPPKGKRPDRLKRVGPVSFPGLTHT
ncbi:MAG TPA: hypothetical protein VFI29_16340 [Hanamia sp.]|nr:hypothetical protein [Hanamia sp.]